MLNHLEREEIFVPEVLRSRHHGQHRNYTFRDLVVLRAINRLLELGARPKRIKQAMESFAKACPETIGDVSMDGTQLKFATASGHFVVTAREVLYCSKEEVIDLLGSGQLAFSFMVDSNVSTLPSLKAAAEIISLSKVVRRKADTVEQIAKRYAL